MSSMEFFLRFSAYLNALSSMFSISMADKDGRKRTDGGKTIRIASVRVRIRQVSIALSIYMVDIVKPLMNIFFVVFSYLARHGMTNGNEKMSGRRRRRLSGK